jgi:hypothetical protein
VFEESMLAAKMEEENIPEEVMGRFSYSSLCSICFSGRRF